MPILKVVNKFSPIIFTIILLITSISFTTSLAWNAAAQKTFTRFFGAGDDWIGSLVFAFILTVCLISIGYISASYFPDIINDA